MEVRLKLNEVNITPRVLEITSRNFRKCKNLEWNLLYGWNWDCANPDVCPSTENLKFYWNLLWTAPTYTYSYKDIRFEILSNVERMVVWRKPPHHCRPRQSCKWTMTYPYIWMFKQWWRVKKYINILCWFYYRILPLDVMVMHKFSYWRHGGHRRFSWWQYTAW